MKIAVLITLLLGVVHTHAKCHKHKSRKIHKDADNTIITNENTNVLVSADPSVVAVELMKLFEERGLATSRRSLPSIEMYMELEKVIEPFVYPSGENAENRTPSELADSAQNAIRKMIIKNSNEPLSIQKEIAIREIVVEMLKALKVARRRSAVPETEPKDAEDLPDVDSSTADANLATE